MKKILGFLATIPFLGMSLWTWACDKNVCSFYNVYLHIFALAIMVGIVWLFVWGIDKIFFDK